MYGVIDIGSNTVRLSCYKVVKKELIYVFHKKNMAGLASYVGKDGALSNKGIQTSIDILNDFKKIVTCVGLDQLYVIATASFRNVSNTKEIVDRIYKSTGIMVNVLTGQEEAVCDFFGATYHTCYNYGMIVDIGGGSTELVCFEKEKTKKAVSISVGSLNFYYRYVEKIFPTEKEEKEIRKAVREELEQLGIKKQSLIIGVGGTYRACLKLYNDFYYLKPDNKSMDSDSISYMLEQLNNGKKVKKNRILRIVPDRVHTILPGIILIDEINKMYRTKKIEVSSWGVREGYLIQELL